MDRRAFIKSSLLTAGSLAVSPHLLANPARSAYKGPNVVIVRFGGGVRRRETLIPQNTYCPYFLKKLVPQGTLFNNMEMLDDNAVNTSHGEGTLYILTGAFDEYRDIEGKELSQRYIPKSPTLFEYLRKSHDIGDHETLMINGEDRVTEEFYTVSNHKGYGIEARGRVVSLYRYKLFSIREQLKNDNLSEDKRQVLLKELAKLNDQNFMPSEFNDESAPIQKLWEAWREHYGDSGLLNPRGDRLLTELSLWSMKHLRPRMLMVNYNDCDYVHWGVKSHYTRGISIMDLGLRQLVDFIDRDAFYRDNTILVVVPDCGRDSQKMMAIPYQHHFGDRTSHEIFALFRGPGIPRNRIVDRFTLQSSVAPTLGRLMGIDTPHCTGPDLREVLS